MWYCIYYIIVFIGILAGMYYAETKNKAVPQKSSCHLGCCYVCDIIINIKMEKKEYAQ